MYVGNGNTTSTVPGAGAALGEMKGNQPVLSWKRFRARRPIRFCGRDGSINLPPVVIFPRRPRCRQLRRRLKPRPRPLGWFRRTRQTGLWSTPIPWPPPRPTLSPQITNTFTETWTPASYESIATTSNTLYVDTAVGSDASHGYLYVVVALQVDPTGKVTGTSPSSNVILAPSVTPPTTITSVNQMVGSWTSDHRNRFVSAAGHTSS